MCRPSSAETTLAATAGRPDDKKTGAKIGRLGKSSSRGCAALRTNDSDSHSSCHWQWEAAKPSPPCLDLVEEGPRQGTNTGLRAQGRLCRGEYKLEIVTQRRAAEDESDHQQICQARDTGSCACIAELCTEKASSPEHRSLALCTHRSAWSSPLSPRKPCHGMQTGSEASPPLAWTLLTEDLAKVPQHGAKSSRARMPWRVQTRNLNTAQGCRRRDAPPTKNRPSAGYRELRLHS